MNEYVGQLMSRMTLQEKIGQLNLMVAGDITTGSTMDTQVAGDIAAGKMGGVFNIKGFDKIKALQDVAIRKSRLGIPLLVGMDVIHGYETIFPIPLALSCSWNEEALRQVGAVSAREASSRCPLGTHQRRLRRGPIPQWCLGSSHDSRLSAG